MCNLCSLNAIKESAKAEGKRVTVLFDRNYSLGGMNVYVHPADINVRNLEGIHDSDHPNHKKYFVAWFMEIPEKHVD